ncbi:MAG: DUF4058 family protein [Cyanobacteria bacterium P01_C01_bin.120]
MTGKPNFPGMNPYLEHPALWPEMHTFIIVNLARTLNTQIVPKYRAAAERRIYQDTVLVGIPDNVVFRRSSFENTTGSSVSSTAAAVAEPERVTVPALEEVREPYLEIREIATGKVITAVELLSPANKRNGTGRQQYVSKRQSRLNSQTHFVEIDLLRTGEPMPIAGGRQSDYQVMVSRSPDRPVADRYPFNLSDPIPCFCLPLQAGDMESIIDLGQTLQQASEEAAIDLAIDYSQFPHPPLSDEQTHWLKTLTQSV